MKRLIMLPHFIVGRKRFFSIFSFFGFCSRSLTLGTPANLFFTLSSRRSLLLNETLRLKGCALSLAVSALTLGNPRRLRAVAPSYRRALVGALSSRGTPVRRRRLRTTRTRRRPSTAVPLRGRILLKARALSRVTSAPAYARGRLSTHTRLRARLARPRAFFLAAGNVDVRAALGTRGSIIRHGGASLGSGSTLGSTLGKR